MKNRIIITQGVTVGEKLELGFKFASEIASNENKSISLIGLSNDIIKRSIDSLFGISFFKRIETTGKVNIKNRIIDINIITAYNLNTTTANEIALYVYPNAELLELMENKEEITDEIVVPYLEKDIQNYKAKWNL